MPSLTDTTTEWLDYSMSSNNGYELVYADTICQCDILGPDAGRRASFGKSF